MIAGASALSLHAGSERLTIRKRRFCCTPARGAAQQHKEVGHNAPWSRKRRRGQRVAYRYLSISPRSEHQQKGCSALCCVAVALTRALPVSGCGVRADRGVVSASSLLCRRSCSLCLHAAPRSRRSSLPCASTPLRDDSSLATLDQHAESSMENRGAQWPPRVRMCRSSRGTGRTSVRSSHRRSRNDPRRCECVERGVHAVRRRRRATLFLPLLCSHSARPAPHRSLPHSRCLSHSRSRRDQSLVLQACEAAPSRSHWIIQFRTVHSHPERV